jgi:beta-mannosidase
MTSIYKPSKLRVVGLVLGIMFYTLISAAQVASPLGRSGGASSIMLNTNWQFRQVGTQTWYPATVPGTVHTDLMDNGLIGDPFKDNNEKKLQWIENENWEYRMVFDVEPNQFNQKHHELYFEGLDTYAEVFLNGKPILDANNMFRSWRVDVTGQLKEKANELHIVFTSPILKNDSIARANVKLPGGSDTSEYPVWPYTRKAAYHFGWDWAPRFVTSGIWKDIVLESWSDYRIWDVYHEIILENSASTEAWIETVISGSSNVRNNCYSGVKWHNKFQIQLLQDILMAIVHIEIENPKLWWPNGSGEPHLYNADVWIVQTGTDTCFRKCAKLE